MVGLAMNISDDPSILSWCGSTGGPTLCESNPVTKAACLARFLAPAEVRGEIGFCIHELEGVFVHRDKK